MPIRGLSESTRRRLPRLGKIHLGVRVQGKESDYPQPTDYFVCPPELQAHLGQKRPRELIIVFPTDDPEQWASAWYRAYSRYRGLVCRGDGQTARRMVDLAGVVDPETGELLPKDRNPSSWPRARRDTEEVGYFDIDCPGPKCPDFQAKVCRPVMNLQFMIPTYPELGVWQIDTGSWNGMRNILNTVELVKASLGGRISMIPLKLSLVPLEVQPDGVKKTVRVLQLTVPYSLVELHERAKLPPGDSVALPEPDLEVPSDLFVSEAEDAQETGPFDSIGDPGERALDRAGISRASAAASRETAVQTPLATAGSRAAPPRVREAWDAVRAALRDMPPDTTAKAARWLAKESGREVSVNVFRQAQPPADIPVSLIIELAQRLRK